MQPSYLHLVDVGQSTRDSVPGKNLQKRYGLWDGPARILKVYRKGRFHHLGSRISGEGFEDTSSQRNRNNPTGSKDLYVKAKDRIWSWLPYMCRSLDSRGCVRIPSRGHVTKHRSSPLHRHSPPSNFPIGFGSCLRAETTRSPS